GGRSFLVSSHVLAEFAQTVDDVVVICNGRSVAQAPLDRLVAEHGGGVRVAGPDVQALRETGEPRRLMAWNMAACRNSSAGSADPVSLALGAEPSDGGVLRAVVACDVRRLAC